MTNKECKNTELESNEIQKYKISNMAATHGCPLYLVRLVYYVTIRLKKTMTTVTIGLNTYQIHNKNGKYWIDPLLFLLLQNAHGN